MATSGTTAFLPDFTEIAEEAYERTGVEMRTGYELRTARRSMNLLTIEWANRGQNMWTVDSGSIPMIVDTATYSLPTDTIDVLQCIIRTGDGDVATQSDLTIERVSVSQYADTNNKLSVGRPTQVYVDRALANPTLTVWPIPSASSLYVLYYWRTRRIEDSGTGVNDADVVFRFIPALIAGLAYYLSVKLPQVPMEKRMELKQDYEEQFRLASEEDREKATLRIVPRRRRV